MFFKFCNDSVNKVSETASHSLADIMDKFSDDEEKREQIIKNVRKNYLQSETFKKRQQFLYMCGEAMKKKELFEQYFKADMLKLVNDPVLNVRLCLAKTIRHHFIGVLNGAFVFDIDVNDAVRLLKRDR